MKTLFYALLTLTLWIGLTPPAQATHFAFSYGAPTFRVAAFTFQPAFAVQTTAYASYQPFTLAPTVPVFQAAEPCAPPETFEVKNYSAPAVTYTAPALVPAYTQVATLFQTSYSSPRVFAIDRFRVGPVRVTEVARFRAAPAPVVVRQRTVERFGLFGLFGRSVTRTRVLGR